MGKWGGEAIRNRNRAEVVSSSVLDRADASSSEIFILYNFFF